MAERADVVVVGAGVGGLATAIRLGAAGHRVTLCERHPRTGGKLTTGAHDGYHFDLGPSLLTMPEVFDELFRLAGSTIAGELDLVRLDPQFHYHWPGGGELVVPDDPAATATAFDAFAPGAGAAWRRLDARGKRIWDVSERTFFAGPMERPSQLLRRMRSPRDLLAIDALRTVRGRAAALFDDPRLVQWAGRYATYSGSSPSKAPATLLCIPHLESSRGCWYPMGGMGALAAALQRAAVAVGVEIVTGADVAKVRADAAGVTGVELATGDVIEAPVVVANADAEHVYADLLPDRPALARVRRAERSMSGFVVTAAVSGRTPGIGHHNVWFSADDGAEFDALDGGRMAPEPTIYACVSAVTDRTQAPVDGENWFLMINTPAGADLDGDVQRDVVLDHLARRGVDLRSRLVWSATMTPADLAARDRSPGGAIYGSSSNGRRAAFVRPGNRGAWRGLYLVGGSSHPGGGLPLVAISARIVAAMIAADGFSGVSR